MLIWVPLLATLFLWWSWLRPWRWRHHRVVFWCFWLYIEFEGSHTPLHGISVSGGRPRSGKQLDSCSKSVLLPAWFWPLSRKGSNLAPLQLTEGCWPGCIWCVWRWFWGFERSRTPFGWDGSLASGRFTLQFWLREDWSDWRTPHWVIETLPAAVGSRCASRSCRGQLAPCRGTSRSGRMAWCSSRDGWGSPPHWNSELSWRGGEEKSWGMGRRCLCRQLSHRGWWGKTSS